MSTRSIRTLTILSAGVLAAAAGSNSAAPWVEFREETATRLMAPADEGSADIEEKDYAWGDLDNDGDIDLVVVRKQPWEGTGKRRNVLLLNESGVLVDRTVEFASDADIDPDQGFMTPTNDRDVQMTDVDLDGWLDVVVAASFSSTDPKHIGHPRVYINLGEDETTGDWLGLRYEEARIPLLIPASGAPGFSPQFSSVAVGDVTGDGYPDLWFGEEGASADASFDDRLLVNHGVRNPGFFDDETAGRILSTIPDTGALFYASTLTTAVAVADLNDDGENELVRAPPGFVAIAYNDASNPGFFDEEADLPYQAAPYHVSVGDLNDDAFPDLIVTDDGTDRYLLNQGDATTPAFVLNPFSFMHDGSGLPASDEGFGGNSLATDLNNDGWNDVLIADVDLEIAGCARRMHIFQNLGALVAGGDVVLQETTSGVQCASFQGNSSNCMVTGIPSDQLQGVHDVAVFDIDGDGFQDMVLGRCSGTDIWMNVPPTPAGGVPDGDTLVGTPLTATKGLSGRIVLSWGDSCLLGDADYVIYRGSVGDFTSHTPLTCSTAGVTTQMFVPGPGSEYYLVAPTNGRWEGSYGKTSARIERPVSTSSCQPRAVGTCDESP